MEYTMDRLVVTVNGLNYMLGAISHHTRLRVSRRGDRAAIVLFNNDQYIDTLEIGSFVECRVAAIEYYNSVDKDIEEIQYSP